MRLKVKIVTKNSPLNIRGGPSTSFPKIGSLNIGSEVIVNEQKNAGSEIWYKLEDGRGWICHSSTAYSYPLTQTIANLDSTKTTETLVDDAKIDTGDIKKSLNQYGKPMLEYMGQLVAEAYTKAMQLMDSKKDTGNVYGTQQNSVAENNKAGIPAHKTGDDEYIGPVQVYDYFMDYSFIENDLKQMKSNLNIFSDMTFREVNKNLFNKFNRWRMSFPDYNLAKSTSYIFFTRPDLNLLEFTNSGNYILTQQFEKDPYYYYLYKNNMNILLALTSHFSQQHDFHPFLSNTSASFEVSDQYIKTLDIGETLTGYKVQYGKHNIESKTSGSFNISYTDDKELTIYKTHKAWIEYISKVFRGTASPKEEYIKGKILDYACSVYYFLCGQNDEILFWTKCYGVFPTNEPSSAFSWAKDSIVKTPNFSISYSYAFKEDFNPLILSEFNMNSRGNYTYLKSYEKNLLACGTTLTGAPFIETSTQDGNYVFKLRFRK